MTGLTDTHCHIHDAEFGLVGDGRMINVWRSAPDPSPDAMIERAHKNGVSRLICVGSTLDNSHRAVEFVQSRDNCWASIGIHPHDAKEGRAAFDKLAKLADKPKVVAVGEIGLDYFYNHSSKKEQADALRFQIELALAHDLPVIFHVRDAFDDFWPIFDDYQNIRGVLHSFTDSHANFMAAMTRDLYIGVNGIMTFTKVAEQLQVAKEVPLQKLLLETDAPFLTPKPLRGTVNEPAHVRLVAEFLADLRGEPLAELTNQTSQNAQRLFALN
ncbi:MAG TPA: TatD family hydrolase [Magnetospirillaceae bacterium]|nr:TatD family hydrolase [Magnetospirillaceae bacterium]